MDWKQKLIAATGAFVSMPLVHAEEISLSAGARRLPRVKQSVSSVPFIVDFGVEKLFVAIRMPEIAGNRQEDESLRCKEFSAEATLVDTENGAELKKEVRAMSIGGGTIVSFDLRDIFGIRSGSASADVSVYAVGDEGSEVCKSNLALVSFTIDGSDGRTFVPSKVGEKIPAHFIKEVKVEH